MSIDREFYYTKRIVDDLETLLSRGWSIHFDVASDTVLATYNDKQTIEVGFKLPLSARLMTDLLIECAKAEKQGN